MYSAEFKEQAILKVLQRGDKTLQTIADELNIKLFTLKEWLRKSRSTMTDNTVPKCPADWTRVQKFQALMQSSSLNSEALNILCREQGIFAHPLEAWKAEFIQETGKTETSGKSVSDKALREENAQLRKELNRKEKALAETAALLVLQKKVPGVLGGKGMMTGLAEREQLLSFLTRPSMQAQEPSKPLPSWV